MPYVIFLPWASAEPINKIPYVRHILQSAGIANPAGRAHLEHTPRLTAGATARRPRRAAGARGSPSRGTGGWFQIWQSTNINHQLFPGTRTHRIENAPRGTQSDGKLGYQVLKITSGSAPMVLLNPYLGCLAGIRRSCLQSSSGFYRR